MNPAAHLAEHLPTAYRLALSYASAAMRERLVGLLALDARLAGIVRHSREPMLAQLRLAWWREQLSCGEKYEGGKDPLLGLLAAWNEDRGVLAGLADGWEGMIGDAPLPLPVFEQLAEARAAAVSRLARAGHDAEVALRMARNWALADIAGRLSHEEERKAVRELALRQDWRGAACPAGLKALAMLHHLARRNLAAGRPADTLDAPGAAAMVRIGLLGR